MLLKKVLHEITILSCWHIMNLHVSSLIHSTFIIHMKACLWEWRDGSVTKGQAHNQNDQKFNPEILQMSYSQLPRNTCCHSASSLSNCDFSKVNFICGMKTAPKPMHLLLVMSLSKYTQKNTICYIRRLPFSDSTYIYVHLC